MIRRLKHTYLRLSAEEKVAAFGMLLVILGAFMPWYQLNLNVNQKQVVETGFSGDLGVVGFVVFLMTVIALLTLVAEHMRFRMPYFGYTKEKIVLFFMAQSSFLLFLDMAIYTKRSFDFTDAELRFGLYAALIGAVLATFSAYALLRKLNKKEVQAFFNQNEADLSTDEEEPMDAEETVTEPESEPEEEEAEQMSLEDMEETVKEVEEEEMEEEPATIEVIEEIVEIEPVLENESELEEEILAEESPEPAEELPEEESPEEEKPKKGRDNISMGFYED